MLKSYRFPLAGPYNPRVGAVNLLPSASGIVGLGIIGVMTVGTTGSTSNKDRRFINCWPETVIDTHSQTKKIYLVKRPGFAAATTPQSGSVGNAIMVWSGLGAGTSVISAFGATNSSIYNGTTQLVTNNGDTTIITGLATAITETAISNTPTICITSSDNTAWYYQDAGTVTKIADADYPGNASKTIVGTFAHMDGYAFVMDSNGDIWNSDLNSITSWAASNYIPTNSAPDKGRGVIRKGDKIMAFGVETIQFFRNAGNPSGSPLQRIEEMTIKVGAVSADAITQIGDTVYWVGSTPEGGLSVYSYSGEYKTVSTSEIGRLLQLVGAGNIKLTSAKIYGRSQVIVLAGTNTYAYVVEEDSWCEWAGSQGTYWHKCASVSSGSSQVIYSISTTLTGGKVLVVNPASYSFQDDGNSYVSTAQSGLSGDGTVKTYWWDVELLADVESSSSVVSIYASDDDYETASLLGSIDLSTTRPKLHRCGASYRRAWIIQHSSNAPFRIEAIAGKFTEGAH